MFFSFEMQTFFYTVFTCNNNAIIFSFFSLLIPKKAPLNIHNLKVDRRGECHPFKPLAMTFDPNEVKGHTEKEVNGKQGTFV